MLWFYLRVKKNTSAIEAVKNAYHDNKTDEFVLPTVIMENNKPVASYK